MIGQTSYEKGLAEGRRRFLKVVRKMIENRFGPLDKMARDRLESFDDEAIDNLSEAFLEASSLKDLGLAE